MNKEEKQTLEFKPGKITIVRTNCNDRSDYISILLQDTEYRLSADARIDLKSFTEALTGLGCVDCEIRNRRDNE